MDRGIGKADGPEQWIPRVRPAVHRRTEPEKRAASVREWVEALPAALAVLGLGCGRGADRSNPRPSALQDFRAGRLGAFASGVPQTLSFGGYQRAAEESEFFTQHFDRIVPWVCCFC